MRFQLQDNVSGITCRDRKSTRLNSSHLGISYAVFCLKKKKIIDSSNGSHSATPIPRRNARRGRCFFVMNMLSVLHRRLSLLDVCALSGLDSQELVVRRNRRVPSRGVNLRNPEWRAPAPFAHAAEWASRRPTPPRGPESREAADSKAGRRFALHYTCLDSPDKPAWNSMSTSRCTPVQEV